MKCANCDAEIKDGSIYCPICGKEAQMISGYSSLEDDLLHSLLRENKTPKQTKEENSSAKKINQRLPIFLTCAALTFLILVGVIARLVINNHNENSYEYQMEMAREELVDHNYESALGYLKKALALSPSDVESRLEMAEIYNMKEQYDEATVLLMEVVQLDKHNEKGYELLIDIYAKRELYGQITNLYNYVEDANIQKLFEKYIVEKPNVYPEGGKFDEAVAVSILSIEDEPIFYTTDGSDPTTEGELYVGEVFLERSGFYTIKAVCKNIKNNVYSEVVEYEYQLEILPPSVTDVTPNEEVIPDTESIE